MCLGIPVKVIEVFDANMGKVDYHGTKIKASFALVEDIKVGDWVILHAGHAISKLNEAEARETLQLFEEIVQAEQQHED
jgi:hydrogenase expression/formation protein HypC